MIREAAAVGSAHYRPHVDARGCGTQPPDPRPATACRLPDQVILPAKLGAGVQLVNIVLPFLSVALSMTVGAFGGLLLGVLLRPRATMGLIPSVAGAHAAAGESVAQSR